MIKFNQIIIVLFVVAILTGQQSAAQKKKKDSQASTEKLAEAEFNLTEGMKFIMMEDYAKAIAPLQKALDIAPDNAGLNHAMAEAYIKQNDLTKALPFAENAYQGDKTNKFYIVALADIYVQKKKYPEAEKLYKSLLEQYPTEAEYGLELAAIYQFQDQWQEAIKVYDKVEKQVGVNDELSHQKQMIWLKNNKIEEAIKEAEKLIKSDPTEPDFMIDLVELLMTNNRIDQAQPWLEKILKLDPQNAQAHVMLAESYRSKGDLERCDQELNIAFNDHGLDLTTKAKILMSYAAMSTNESSKDKAIALAKVLIKVHPKEAKGYIIYGDLLLSKNQKSPARDAYAKALRLDKSVFELWARVVQLDQELMQADSCLVHSEEAIEVFPNQPIFWYANGTSHYFRKDFKEAASSLEEARRLATANSDRQSDAYRLARFINGLLGDTYNSMGKHSKSDEAYEAALVDDPNDDHVLNNYSYFLSLRKEKLVLAVEMAARLVEKHPDDGTYLDTYAWVLYVNKEYAKARLFLEKAVANNKNNSGTIVEHYGDVLFQLGDKDKAIEQWKKAKTMPGGSHLLDKKIMSGVLIEQ